MIICKSIEWTWTILHCLYECGKSENDRLLSVVFNRTRWERKKKQKTIRIVWNNVLTFNMGESMRKFEVHVYIRNDQIESRWINVHVYDWRWYMNWAWFRKKSCLIVFIYQSWYFNDQPNCTCNLLAIKTIHHSSKSIQFCCSNYFRRIYMLTLWYFRRKMSKRMMRWHPKNPKNSLITDQVYVCRVFEYKKTSLGLLFCFSHINGLPFVVICSASRKNCILKPVQYAKKKKKYEKFTVVWLVVHRYNSKKQTQ